MTNNYRCYYRRLFVRHGKKYVFPRTHFLSKANFICFSRPYHVRRRAVSWAPCTNFTRGQTMASEKLNTNVLGIYTRNVLDVLTTNRGRKVMIIIVARLSHVDCYKSIIV